MSFIIVTLIAAVAGFYGWQALAPKPVILIFVYNMLFGAPVALLGSKRVIWADLATGLYAVVLGVLTQLPGALTNKTDSPLSFAILTGGIWYFAASLLAIIYFRLVKW